MTKTNCWEFCGCGMNIPGKHTVEKGQCPVFMARDLDGVNGGKAAGRFCWSVAGTMNGSAPHVNCAEKKIKCDECLFYKYVKVEEMENFTSTKTDAMEWKMRREQR